jgi:hypothetical protein
MCLNHHAVTWETDIIPMKVGKKAFYQCLIDEYSQVVKIHDPDYEHNIVKLDDVIRTCEKLYVEEQHQIKKEIQNNYFFNLFDGV